MNANSYLITSIFFFLFFGFILYILKRGNRPIRKLTDSTRKFLEGNNDLHLDIQEPDKYGKYGEFVEVINQLTEKLHSAQTELNHTKIELQKFHNEFEQKIRDRDEQLYSSREQLVQEINERLAMEDRLRIANRIIENTREAIVITDSRAIILDVNPAYCDITGLSRKEAIGANASITKSGRHSKNFYRKMWDDLLSSGQWKGEIWDRKKDGSIFLKWMSIHSVKNDSNMTICYVGIFTELTNIRRTEDQLLKLAFYDPLTKLPNRILLMEKMMQEFALSDRHKYKTGIFVIDLNRFKYINDTLGHFFGDKLLIAVAERLKHSVRKTDTVSRLGGDEYAIILSEIKQSELLGNIAKKIINNFKTPFVIDKKDFYAEVAIGISIYPDDGNEMDTILKHADVAMYRAKLSGRGAFNFFTKEMEEHGNYRLEMDREIRESLDDKDFVVYYQPIVNLNTNKISSLEALIRWDHPQKGIIAPDFFIPFSEEAGFIIQLEEIVLDLVCHQLAHWDFNRFSTVPIAINISPTHIVQSSFVDKIRYTLSKYGIKGEQIQIELIERALMENSYPVQDIINRMYEIGVKVNIDDFGTGYSSLSYLNAFKVSKIKIDRSFIKELPSNPKSAALTRTIIAMANSLGLQTIAEGVENELQRSFLIREKCVDMQGFLFSKPLPAEEVEKFLSKK